VGRSGAIWPGRSRPVGVMVVDFAKRRARNQGARSSFQIFRPNPATHGANARHARQIGRAGAAVGNRSGVLITCLGTRA